MENNYFIELNNINVSDKIEKKNGLSYLSWAWAWGELKKIYPNATYTIYENVDGWNYHTDNLTGWVKTGVTINDIEHIEYLPIMDYRNKSIKANDITSFDVNKAIQRSLTKAVARHGLGLYIYAGEDLPETVELITKVQIKEMNDLQVNIDGVLKYYKVNKLEDLTKAQADFVISKKRKELEKEFEKQQKAKYAETVLKNVLDARVNNNFKEVDINKQNEKLEEIK